MTDRRAWRIVVRHCVSMLIWHEALSELAALLGLWASETVTKGKPAFKAYSHRIHSGEDTNPGNWTFFLEVHSPQVITVARLFYLGSSDRIHSAFKQSRSSAGVAVTVLIVVVV